MTAATALADQGFETHLVEKGDQLGGMLNDLETIAPAENPAHELVDAKARHIRKSHVKVHLNSTVEMVGGVVGNFNAHLSDGKDLTVGALVVATGAHPYTAKRIRLWQE